MGGTRPTPPDPMVTAQAQQGIQPGRDAGCGDVQPDEPEHAVGECQLLWRAGDP